MPRVHLADVQANTAEICSLIERGEKCGASIVLFPELSVTGYSCADLFGTSVLVDNAEKGIGQIVEFSRGKKVTAVVGAPVRYRNHLYNCAVVIRNGRIHGISPKIHLSAGEYRQFTSGQGCNDEIPYAGCKGRCRFSPYTIYNIGECSFGIEIGEERSTPIPPSAHLVLAGAGLILNPSAETESVSGYGCRKEALRRQSVRNICAYVHCSAGYGESSQEGVCPGAAMVCEHGGLIAEKARFEMSSSFLPADIDCEKLSIMRRKCHTFSACTPEGGTYGEVDLGTAAEVDFGATLHHPIDALPCLPQGNKDEQMNEIVEIQAMGLASRLAHINCRTAVIGISGGLDSTLALLVCALAFDKLGWSRERIIGVTMPGYGTTDRTRNNAENLMEALQISRRKISITAACDQHFADIGHDKAVHDTTFENAQARERTQILMDIANQTGGIVIGTGDMSELALGWATYNGDHMSMYGVNAGVPKTLIRMAVKWIADNLFKNDRTEAGCHAGEILNDILDTPVSPELLPADNKGNIAQITEDIVGPYELHDFFLYNFVKYGFASGKILFLAKKAFEGQYDAATIEKWLKTFMKRFFSQQFKRSCMPDGPKVIEFSLSPRSDWQMPSDATMPLSFR